MRLLNTLLLFSAIVATAPLLAQVQGEAPANPTTEETPADPIGDLIEAINADDNGITINREDRYVDLASNVCMREGEFLEMFACAKDSREHESILVIDAKPSEVHMALLLMGIEPGAPMSWEETDEAVLVIPPRGPEIGVFVIVETRGEEVMRPANEWIMDQKTEEIMEGNVWLFAGSDFTQMNGREVYRADAYGTAISLVSFGDDMLARANDLTDDNASHANVWGTRTDQIPDVGTPVTIRLQLPEPEEAGDAEDADSSESQDAQDDPSEP